MPSVRWSSDAKRDLAEIAHFIGVEQGRLRIAERLIDGVVKKSNTYAASPELGTAREDLGNEIRVFRYKRYVIVYRPVETGIDIIRIVDGARDFPSLFE